MCVDGEDLNWGNGLFYWAFVLLYIISETYFCYNCMSTTSDKLAEAMAKVAAVISERSSAAL